SPPRRRGPHSLETTADAQRHRVARAELYPVHILIEGHLKERVRLQALGERVAHAGADEERAAAGVVALGELAAVAAAGEEVRLEHQARALVEGVANAGVERELLSLTVAVVEAERKLEQTLHEPAQSRERKCVGVVAADQEVGRAGAGLQRALREQSLVVRHARAAGRKLEPEVEPRR